MSGRLDREDLTRQTEKLATARADLAVALDGLAAAATLAARAARSKAKRPPAVDLDPVHAWTRTVGIREESVDQAAYDLHTAAGGHG